MKAWVLHGINEIRLETVELPALESGQALVAVKAAGICGSDIPRIYRTGAHRHPLIPGHEFSGVVESVGKETDSAWLGKRVGVFPLIPCGACGPCIKGQYEMCRNYGYLGSRRDGGFAEYVAVPAGNLIELPDCVSFEEAAMLEPMAVAVHAMRRVLPEESRAESGPTGAVNASGQTTHGESRKPEQALPAETDGRGQSMNQPQTDAVAPQAVEGILPAGTGVEETIVVFGLGTIGLLLTALLLERGKSRRKSGSSGGRILVIGNKDFQRQKILELGLSAEAYCDSRAQDAGRWILERTGGRGGDVIFECVGRNETLRQAVDSAAPAGRICLVGNPASDMALEREVYWKILRNQLTVTGTWNSSFSHKASDDWHYALERLSRKDLMPSRLISHRFSLEEMEKGLHIMRDKSEDYVKIMAVI
nr:galactitol-1-phosphate 5-dehydrogenase [uncultured Acetatifactor sp.]